jgi:hypothetical protein
MSDQISFLPMLDAAEHPTWLLSGKTGIKNDCGVYTENVLEFREGLIPHNWVCVSLCAEGDFVLFEFSYQAGTYGCAHPLCRPCHECHRANSAKFLGDCIYNVFVNCVIPYDRNLTDPKENKMLSRMCRKVCDKIAKEVV